MIESCREIHLSSQRRKRRLTLYGRLFAAVLVTAKSLGMTVEETPKG